MIELNWKDDTVTVTVDETPHPTIPGLAVCECPCDCGRWVVLHCPAPSTGERPGALVTGLHSPAVAWAWIDLALAPFDLDWTRSGDELRNEISATALQIAVTFVRILDVNLQTLQQLHLQHHAGALL